MCGRFALSVDITTLREEFPWIEWPADLASSFNIAPSQKVAVVTNSGENRLEFFEWGLIPSWAKDPTIGNKLINARSETLAEKPSFRNAYKKRRCLILSSGYFEWMRNPSGSGSKIPLFIRLKSRKHMAFAGLWERWQPKDEPGDLRLTCTIITSEPNEFLKQYHHRMPVILHESGYQRWLDPQERSPDELQDLLIPYSPDDFEVFPVSPEVNNPRNNSSSLLDPVG